MGIPEFLEAVKRYDLSCNIRYAEVLHSYSIRFSRTVLDVPRFWEYTMPEEYIHIEGMFGALLETAMRHLSDDAIIAQVREKLNRMPKGG